MVSPEEKERYSRQVLFRPIGETGQERLKASRVAIVGMGALGTAQGAQLARAGVGFLRLVDRDIIETSNLQRQSLYDESDARDSAPKAVAAARKLKLSNSFTDIEPAVADLTAQNAERLLADCHLILDGTDNMQVRHLINEVSVKHGIPWVYGGAVSSYGTTGLLRPGVTPCLVCLFGDEDGGGHDTCDTVGVIAPAVSLIAALQVAEALKYLTGNEDALRGGLVYADVWTNEFRSVRYGPPKPDCPCCARREFPALSRRGDALTVSFCGRRTIQVRPANTSPPSFERLAGRLAAVGSVRHTDNLLRLDLGEVQVSLFADGRALIHGVDDEAQARSVYARYIGM